jgi:hypothetical protein
VAKDEFDWKEARRQAAERARKEREARNDQIRKQLEDAAEREAIERDMDDSMDSEFLDLLGASSIGELTDTEFDDPSVQAAVDKIRAAENAWFDKKGKRRKALKNATKHKTKIKRQLKKNKKGCAVVAIAMFGSAVAGLSAIGYAGYEIVSRFV